MAVPTPATCLIKSYTLSPGEPFILPPGATVIGATNVDGLTSLCSDLENLEQVQCYVVILAGMANTNTKSDYFEETQQEVQGFELNGIFTAFDGGSVQNSGFLGSFDKDVLKSKLLAKLPGVLYAEGLIRNAVNNNTSSRTIILIQTIPSIGKNLSLKIITFANDGGNNVNGGTGFAFYNAKFISLDEAIALGHIDLPTCPGNNIPPQT